MNKAHSFSPEVQDALLKGDIKKVNGLLGYVYRISGVVVLGNQLGRTLGFPTANIELPGKQVFIPAPGVYAVKTTVNGQVLNGMLNAGFRPTFDGKKLTVEVNLFGFSGDLYGQTLEIQLIDRLRDEQKFESVDHLVRQLHLDREEALKLLL
jgi:riboflavin kinase/FMN adenylyltransferase